MATQPISYGHPKIKLDVAYAGTQSVKQVVAWAFEHPKLAAPVLVFLASYILYGVIGKKRLGADDDYWEVIRARLLNIVHKIAVARGGYAKTESLRAEYAGTIEMDPDEYERKLQEAGYLRQVVSSLHYDSEGRKEAGSWSRMYGPLYPIEYTFAWLTEGKLRIPFFAEYTRRFLRSLNTVLALRQYHEVHYVNKNPRSPVRIYSYCHSEYNPLNPFVCWLHYSGIGARPAPEVIVRDMGKVGVELEYERS